MRFEDHITVYWDRAVRGFDTLSAWRRIEDLCALMMATMAVAEDFLPVARQIRKEVRNMIVSAMQVRRYDLKLCMLRSPEWRYRVIKELGGVETLLRLWRRLSDPPSPMKRQMKALSWEEEKMREHIKRCAKACAHPNIYRDPFKVDVEGRFRLPPMPRRASATPSKQRARDYVYDARPVNDFKGLKQPIMVWPDEFMVFMSYELPTAESEVEVARDPYSARRYSFVDKWLSAILADTAQGMPAPPLVKVKTARAPPVLMSFIKATPSVARGRWVCVLPPPFHCATKLFFGGNRALTSRAKSLKGPNNLRVGVVPPL